MRKDQNNEPSGINDIRMEVRHIPVYPSGVYPCTFTRIEASKQVPYGAPTDSEPTDPCFIWYFTPDTQPEDQDPNKPFSFLRTTGVSYGGKRANLSKLILGLIGRPLSGDEVSRLRIGKLIGQRVQLLVSKQFADDGSEYNKVESVERLDGKTLNLDPLLDD